MKLDKGTLRLLFEELGKLGRQEVHRVKVNQGRKSLRKVVLGCLSPIGYQSWLLRGVE